jgi:hypothetical protein
MHLTVLERLHPSMFRIRLGLLVARTLQFPLAFVLFQGFAGDCVCIPRLWVRAIAKFCYTARVSCVYREFLLLQAWFLVIAKS